MIVLCVYVKLITEECRSEQLLVEIILNFNHTVLARDIENYDWNPVYAETNVNIALDYMEQGLTTIIDRHTPNVTKHVEGRKCFWL